MARKPLHINLSFDGQQWVGQGGRVSAKGPTLRAAKQRVRMAAEELYGEGVEYTISIQLPTGLRDKVSGNREMQEQLETLRVRLREDTAETVELLRIKLGFGITDAAEILGVDASTLTRLMSSTSRFKAD